MISKNMPMCHMGLFNKRRELKKTQNATDGLEGVFLLLFLLHFLENLNAAMQWKESHFPMVYERAQEGRLGKSPSFFCFKKIATPSCFFTALSFKE